MASVLSLVLATLVVGTIYNLVDVAVNEGKPYQPIHELMMDPMEWVVAYFLAAVAGGIVLLLNLWLDPWLSVLLVAVAAFIFGVVIKLTDEGLAREDYIQELKECAVGLLALVLLTSMTAAGTLGLLSLINI